MSNRRPVLLAFLVVGLVLGWAISGTRPTVLRADGPPTVPVGITDLMKSQVASGPIAMVTHPKSQTLYPVEAVYYLDYRGGRLLAAVPSGPSTASETAAQGRAGERLVSSFAERDLAADFQISAGVEPHFLMTVARMGFINGGWAPLFIFETATNQVATYRVIPETVGTVTRPKIQLLDRKSLAKTALPPVER